MANLHNEWSYMIFKIGDIIKHNDSFEGFIGYETERIVIGFKTIGKITYYILESDKGILDLTTKWVDKTYRICNG